MNILTLDIFAGVSSETNDNLEIFDIVCNFDVFSIVFKTKQLKFFLQIKQV